MSSRKKITTAKEKNTYFSALQHLWSSAQDTRKRSQERFKPNIDRRVLKGRKRIQFGNYIMIEVSEGVAITPKVRYKVEGPYQEFDYD